MSRTTHHRDGQIAESCGQCPVCKLGTGRMTDALRAVERRDHTSSALARLHRRLRTVSDGNRCFLPVEVQQVIGSLLRTFPEDAIAHIDGTCRLWHDAIVPKITDLDDGSVVYDERVQRKRPDWPYAA